MNYSNWTDFAINAAVGAATGEAKNSEPAFSLVIRNADGKRFDPCNSWSDAGPIIEKFKISLIAMHHQVSCWQADAGEDCEFEIADQDNPLRAAMIVFLMMQEKPNA